MVWAFRSNLCLECMSPARALRELDAEFAGQVAIHLVASSGDSVLVAHFVARERIAGTLSFASRSVLNSCFGAANEPSLALYRDTTMIGRFQYDAARPGGVRLATDSLLLLVRKELGKDSVVVTGHVTANNT